MRSRCRAVAVALLALLTVAATVAVYPAAATHRGAEHPPPDRTRVGLWLSAGEVDEGGSLTVTAELSKPNATGAALSIPIRFTPIGWPWSASADDLNMPSSVSIANGARIGTATVTIVDDNVREEFEAGNIELGRLPRKFVPWHYRHLAGEVENVGSSAVHFWIRPSDHTDLGRLDFRVCGRADNSCPVGGDAGWVETATPELTLTEGGSARSYQYKLTGADTAFHHVEVSPKVVEKKTIGNASSDRDRLTCVASADHGIALREYRTGLTPSFQGAYINPADPASGCPHRANTLGWGERDVWQTVTFSAGEDLDTLDHTIMVTHHTVTRITGHRYKGHFFQDPAGWPVTITITDDDAPDQDVEFSAGANGSTWVAMNDGGGVDTALPDVLVPGQTYSFRVRLKNRNLEPSQTNILTLRSESHSQDVQMSLIWNNGAEDAEWFQRLDFKTSSKRSRVYTVRVHVAADAKSGNVVFTETTPPGFWSRAGAPQNRHYWSGTVARIAPHVLERTSLGVPQDAPVSDSNDAPLDEATLIAEVNAHIADFTSRNHANGVRDWNLILDRLEGRTGMSDADIAVWLARSRQHGWQDGVTTLPKVQAFLAAPQPVSVPEVNITGSVGGTEGSGVSFTVSAVPSPTADLAVGVAVSASGDFGVSTGTRTVTIPAGQSSATVTLSTSDDSVDEADGSVTLTLNSGGGYTVGSLSSQSLQVLDDDDPQQVAAPVVSVSAGAGVTEGGAASFTVSADAAPAADLPVSVTVAASGDYGVTTGSQTVTIAAGTTSKVLSLSTSDDSVDEPDGSVTVTVADGADYDVGTASATVSVADDDDPPPPVVSVSAGAGVTEGGSASFTLTASPPPTSPISVSVTVAASGDFGAATGSRTVSIPIGGSASFSVATSDDSVDEADGSVSVTVADGADYDVGTASATVNIADDDDPPPVEDVPDTDGITDNDDPPPGVQACVGKPTVSVADVTAQRGDDLEFVISIDCAHSSDVDVYYTIAHGLTDAGGGTVTISSGDTTATVRTPTIGASDVGLYLVWVTEVTNPFGVWAYGTITD